MNVVSRYFIHKSGLHCLSSVSTAIIRFNSHITNGRSHVFRFRGYIHCYFNLLQPPPCYNRPSRNLRPNNLSCNLHFGSNLGPLAIMERFDCRYCCGLLISDVCDQKPIFVWTFVKHSEFHGQEFWTFCRGTGLFSCFPPILKGA